MNELRLLIDINKLLSSSFPVNYLTYSQLLQCEMIVCLQNIMYNVYVCGMKQVQYPDAIWKDGIWDNWNIVHREVRTFGR